MVSITNKLLKFQEPEYKKFSQKLIPDTQLEILGVKTPQIKKLAKDLYLSQPVEAEKFLQRKHVFYEEWLLHGFLLSYEKNIDVLFNKLDSFIPHVDNWAICDCTVMALKILKNHPQKSFEFAKKCLKSKRPYTIRFGIVIFLCYFLDEHFSIEILNLIQNINSEHYYVNMGLAWFYSVSLIKQYQPTIKIFIDKKLPKFVHNKSIQKALESFRIPIEKKTYLRTIKV